jgi:hypothetical protein
MFSLGDLPDNHALDVLAGIGRDLDEFKSAQRVGGASLVNHHTMTDATWDINETVPSSVTFIRWRVVFTPDHGGAPFSLLSYDYELTPADSTRPIQSYPDPEYVSGAGVAYIIAFTNNNFSGNALLRIKLAVDSMDTGTLAVSKVFSA